ncbi:MAG: hypothetical protein U0Q18_29915 [Bryobacteraceae bacterium]
MLRTRLTLKLSPIILLCLGIAVLPAQAKPNFSGTWKVDTSKSDFGPIPGPDSQTDKIEHQDPNLKVNVVSTGQMGDLNYDLAYTTDGKEVTNTVGGNEFKSTVNWDGDALVVDTKGSFNGTDFTAKDRWAVSEDGKTLTVERHFSSSMGEADQKVVYAKQ